MIEHYEQYDLNVMFLPSRLRVYTRHPRERDKKDNLIFLVRFTA